MPLAQPSPPLTSEVVSFLPDPQFGRAVVWWLSGLLELILPIDFSVKGKHNG
jgi:hypothetical protein